MDGNRWGADVGSGHAQMARLPQITGFVLGGVLVGPFGLNLLRAEGLPSLAVVRPIACPPIDSHLSSPVTASKNVIASQAGQAWRCSTSRWCERFHTLCLSPHQAAQRDGMRRAAGQ